MREIKFRAWDRDKKIWLKESYNEELFLNFDGDCTRYYNDSCGGWGFEGEYNIELMQFTGLKDKKGKEIYEGDIIQIVNKITRCVVEFKFASFVRKYISKNKIQDYKNYMPQNVKHWEVIGNIHENPELLK